MRKTLKNTLSWTQYYLLQDAVAHDVEARGWGHGRHAVRTAQSLVTLGLLEETTYQHYRATDAGRTFFPLAIVDQRPERRHTARVNAQKFGESVRFTIRHGRAHGWNTNLNETVEQTYDDYVYGQARRAFHEAATVLDLGGRA